MTESKGAGYGVLAAEAEAAVAAVKDPELRRVAFEKILATLLEKEHSPQPSGPQTAKTQKSRQSTRKQAVGTPKPQLGPKAHIEELIRDDFFVEQRTIAEVKAELANRGRHIPLTSLSGPLQKLTQERRLRRQKVVSNGKRAKTTYAYSNW
jgi:hypothetical protein